MAKDTSKDSPPALPQGLFKVTAKAAEGLSSSPEGYPGIRLVEIKKAPGTKSGKDYFAKVVDASVAGVAELVAKVQA